MKKYIWFIIFFVISITTIYSAQEILPGYYDNLYLKQILWYLIGFTSMIIVIKLGKPYIYKICFLLYLLLNILLLGLLFFGNSINGSRGWYNVLGFGFQPSEFMKIVLIILVGILINNYQKQKDKSIKAEFRFLCITFGIIIIPSILTFLQPDTGIVLIYFITTITMLFLSGIRFRWFVFIFLIFFLILTFLLITYFYYKDLFIMIFGSSFFLRIERLLSWSNSTGYQLTNGLSSIGSGGLFGNGYMVTPLYFPEAQTDFIFAVFASNYGFIGSLLLIILFLFFDLKLVDKAKKNTGINKYVITGISSMIVYQQIQNIGMTIGLLPITGITLPFISYGGSSLISYFIIMAFCF